MAAIKTLTRYATYQVGVDVLGFPIYVRHTIIQDEPKYTQKGGDRKGNKWIVGYADVFKQH